MKPLFTHTCNNCTFIKTEEVNDITYDFYLCGRTNIRPGNMIARYSNTPTSYISMPFCVIHNSSHPALIKGKALALEIEGYYCCDK